MAYFCKAACTSSARLLQSLAIFRAASFFAASFSATCFKISAALFMDDTAMKLEGIRNGSIVASSEGRNMEAINPTGFTGAPKPSQPMVSKARSETRVK